MNLVKDAFRRISRSRFQYHVDISISVEFCQICRVSHAELHVFAVLLKVPKQTKISQMKGSGVG